MISTIKINGFQAHRKLAIDLDDRVTTIVGPSDTGKSSAIRAIRWALLNIPVSSLIHDGMKRASVQVSVDGHVIRRERGSENAYWLDDREFRSFRNDVPQPVSDVVNLHSVSFQGQHDAIYWFSASAGEVSRQLNEIVNLEVVDRTLASANKIYNRAKASADACECHLSGLVEQRASLKWIQSAAADYEVVEKFSDKIKRIERRVDDVVNVVRDVRAARKRASASREAADGAATVADAASSVGRLGTAANRVSLLLDAISAADSVRRQSIPDVTDIGEALDAVRSAQSRVDAITNAIQARQNRGEIVLIRKEEYQAAFESMVSAIPICPTCGQEIHNEAAGSCPGI